MPSGAVVRGVIVCSIIVDIGRGLRARNARNDHLIAMILNITWRIFVLIQLHSQGGQCVDQDITVVLGSGHREGKETADDQAKNCYGLHSELCNCALAHSNYCYL